tara:strand:+ start:23973 stop:24128 length:156 start_codon:yes stop_codon:yes gene_type:complete
MNSAKANKSSVAIALAAKQIANTAIRLFNSFADDLCLSAPDTIFRQGIYSA